MGVRVGGEGDAEVGGGAGYENLVGENAGWAGMMYRWCGKRLNWECLGVAWCTVVSSKASRLERCDRLNSSSSNNTRRIHTKCLGRSTQLRLHPFWAKSSEAIHANHVAVEQLFSISLDFHRGNWVARRMNEPNTWHILHGRLNLKNYISTF